MEVRVLSSAVTTQGLAAIRRESFLLEASATDRLRGIRFMPHPLRPWIELWDCLDGNFWGLCHWLERHLTPEEIRWQPVLTVASIGWNLRHLGEMLDHYLTHVFQVREHAVAREPLRTMERGAQDDGQFQDLREIAAYHRVLRPDFREFLTSLGEEEMDRMLPGGRRAHSFAWAVGHIAEHESYHLGKCTLLRNLILARRQPQ